MKPIILRVITLVACTAFFLNSQAQFGTTASAIRIENCTGSKYYNTSGVGPAAISTDNFNNANLGVYTSNTGTLILRGGEVRTFKNPALSNVCNVRMFYRVYLQSGVGGSFTSIALPFVNDCDIPTAQFPSGGSCVAGDQKWNVTSSNINLTAFPAGNYVLEVYYEVDGSSVSTSLCNETISLNNGGGNYKAYFSIQSPVLGSSNPTSCNGTEGSITISGLAAGVVYSVTYNDDGVVVGPANFTANASGQVVISGLNYGSYYDISVSANGCTTDFNTELTLSNFLITPTFPAIPAICQGSVPPALPTTSNNGITGTWSPAIIDNQASGSYTFTPTAGSCGKVITRNITITPKATPTFSFGTTLTICSGGSVPALSGTSTNSITGTWSPATVSNTASDVYTFTPAAGQCALAATFTVTVNPNVTPTFSFGSSLTICSGGTVPALPNTSSNGIAGSWSPSSVSNTSSAVYTFTPAAGVCAPAVTFTVTVNPNTTPVFSFGTTLIICNGDVVPALPGTSTNGITGSWSPATVSNTTSGIYTFTPTPGLCATTTSFTVTVNQKVTPAFSFGSSLSVCSGGTVPALPGTSTNGITGSWSPAAVSNTASGSYTFTPSAGACAIPTVFTVTVNPNVTPTFTFGTSLTICSGGTVPALSTTSAEGITGSWSPSTVSNTGSASYTFTPSAGQCATTTGFSVTVNPNITPVFSFGTSLTICDGGTVPALPATSTNGITGTWSPSTVSNNSSATYTFTPSSGQCATTTIFSVTVNPSIAPAFGFGASLTICSGGSVPALPTTSTNGITGSWSPATIDNTNSGGYIFTPSAGQCALSVGLNVTVNPNVTPTFAFGTSLTICSGGTVPTLVTTSAEGITGSWSPSTVSNTGSASYTFTPSAGQCATTTVFNVTVNPNVTPVFSFGTSLTICQGGTVPVLSTTSTNGITGTWSPSTVGNNSSATYTFTPDAGLCATTATFTVTVNANTTPTFTFGSALTICSGGTVPALPATSGNGISGTWSPSSISNTASNSYIFTPAAGPCATSATFTVTVNPNITPTFSFGTSLSICSGGTVPALPGTSLNGIAGVWSPSSVSNTTSGTYSFTPSAGQCAVAASFNVTVGSNLAPVFSFGSSLTICSGGTVPSLPSVSNNGITGSWNPSTVSNTTSATYSFTPDAGQCAVTGTFTVTVNPNIEPTFSFGSSLTICSGGTVPALPGTSTNGITGSWSPATIDNTNSGGYIFTPSAGQCALSVGLNVTVNPNVTPTFAFGTSLTICSGGTVPTLATTSAEGITGSWSPATVSNTGSASYTFTPSAGQCATTTGFSVTVNPNITPVFSFGTSLTICDGGTVPALPATSTNGITGTWSPSTVSNNSSATYTFTPSAGQCATTTIFSVTVNPNITPAFSFGASLTVCSGATVPALPTTSTNGITGNWSPATIDNTNSGGYIFTPSAGQCALSVGLNVTVNPVVTPVFSFGSSLTICRNATAPSLPSTSSNGITGIWSPSTVSNISSATYTFTPDAGQCALTTSFNVTVTTPTNPTFPFAASITICAGEPLPALPTTSNNGVTGSWSPSTMNNTSSGAYVFTPSPGECSMTAAISVTVNPIVTPAFSFGTNPSICRGSTPPALPTTSSNGITGSWSPSSIDNNNSGSYTFTPDAGQCAVSTTINVTVNTVVDPTFSFGSSLAICAGNTVPALPSTSDNGVAGSWSPATVSNTTSGSYAFTPSPGVCANTTTFTVTVTANAVPTFSFGTSLTICAGETVPALPAVSSNGFNGSWNPATVNNNTSGVYTFTPQTLPGQCISPVIFTVTVNPIVTPAFSFGTTQTICAGGISPVLPSTSTNGITGTWNPAVVSNTTSGIYTFTTASGQCADPTVSLTVTVNPIPSANARPDTTVLDGTVIPGFNPAANPSGVNITWSNSNPGIGLPPAGVGSVPQFVATNPGSAAATAIITITPVLNGCSGSPVQYHINVMPLAKSVFVPNVFSPNNDGKNDVLYVYGSYINMMELRIFNQWGQEITVITDKSKGWDGKFKGKPQPVGVYVYTLRIVLTDGKSVTMKGNISLLR